MGSVPFVRLNEYKKKLSDVAGEVVFVLYSKKLRRRTELLERNTKGLYFLYCYCECVANTWDCFRTGTK